MGAHTPVCMIVRKAPFGAAFVMQNESVCVCVCLKKIYFYFM